LKKSNIFIEIDHSFRDEKNQKILLNNINIFVI